MRFLARARFALAQGSHPKQARRIVDAVNRFAVDGHGDVKHLQGDDALRLRVGDYRVIFDRVGDDVSVRYVSHRREAYRGR